MSYLNKVIICFLSLGIILSLIHYSDFDLKFQSLFFITETKKWLIDRDHLELKFYLYRLPKYFIVAYAISIIFWGIKLWLYEENIILQKKILYLISVLICTPVLVAIIKRYNPISCPSSVTDFGGYLLRISPLDMFNSELFFNYRGKCFPAGHASGGFALISLYFVMPTRRLRLTALYCALTLGWVMGFYQIAKGAHYISDTITTLAIACLVSISLQYIILRYENIKS